ncbi:MAG: DUF6266 family protein [Odoribacter sp.]
MAIFESFLLGNLNQKLANLVMFRSRGKGVVRGKPLNVKNPRTPSQLTQRAKMKLLIDLSRHFSPIIRSSFVEHPHAETVYNTFVRVNMPNVVVDSAFQATLEFSDILCANGILEKPDVTATSDEVGLVFKQEAQTADGTMAMDDVVYVGLYETVQKSARLVQIGERGSAHSIEYLMPKHWIKTNIQIYAFAVSKSKRHSSSTLYVTLS